MEFVRRRCKMLARPVLFLGDRTRVGGELVIMRTAEGAVGGGLVIAGTEELGA